MKDRFPGREESLQMFTVSVIPIHVWAIVVLLNKIPGYLQRLSAAEILGAMAYALSLALFESLAVTGVLIGVVALLPRRMSREKLVLFCGSSVLATAVWVMMLHSFPFVVVSFLGGVVLLNLSLFIQFFFIAWGISYVLLINILLRGIKHNDRWRVRIACFFDRLKVLSWVYVALDLIGLMIVIGRNWG